MNKFLSKKFGIIALIIGTTSFSATTEEAKNSHGGVHSLRGIAELHEEKPAEDLKRVQRDQAPIARDYLHQPPLIPHQIRNYQINAQSNKCLSCHSWKNYRQAGATKISMTHFDTRDGQQLSDVSPRRYFCTQCHVTQADAKPLIKNTFQPLDELSNDK